MVGWFYVNDEVAAPLRMLETDAHSGILSLEVAAQFIPSRSMLRGETVVEYRHWNERRVVRCLGAERVGSALMIEAVGVGKIEHRGSMTSAELGPPEDWLAIDGAACCRVVQLSVGDRENAHCMFRVGLSDWRDLRIGEAAPLACVGVSLEPGHDNDGAITPLLHAARDASNHSHQPIVELIRLRERERYNIQLLATDWSDETTLVVAKVNGVSTLRRSKRSATMQTS
jgi:hypothetical protein